MRRSQAQKLYTVLQYGALTVDGDNIIFTPHSSSELPPLIAMTNNPYTVIRKIYFIIEKMNTSQIT